MGNASLRQLSKKVLAERHGEDYKRVQASQLQVGRQQQAGMQVVGGNVASSVGKTQFLPIREVFCDVEIHESISIMKMVQEFYNPLHSEEAKEAEDKENQSQATGITSGSYEDQSLEVTFKFPKEDNCVISKMTITIGDKIIEAKVQDKVKAEEKYDDAIASGNSGFILQEKLHLHEIGIGNILPGQSVIVEMCLIQPLKIIGGSFNFVLPLSYFPKFDIPAKDVKNQQDSSGCLFNYRISIESKEAISHVSHPPGCEIQEQSINSIIIQQIGSLFDSFSNDIDIYYKTLNMDKPKFFYQECERKYPGYVALMAQFLPTFDTKEQSKTTNKGKGKELVGQTIKYQDDGEEIEEAEVNDSIEKGESQYCYYFVVDRSGSMRSKIDLTIEAMDLFMQSLPPKAKFSIVSFGTNFSYLDSETPFDCTDANIKRAKAQIKYFNADFGGTEILSPLKSVFQQIQEVPKQSFFGSLASKISGKASQSAFKKRVFLLTDGQVSNSNQVIQLIKDNCDNNGVNKVFTFGIGQGADQNLVKESAKQGKGDYCFVDDDNLSTLKTKVIEMLQKAAEPALQDCSFSFVNKSLPYDSNSLFEQSNLEALGEMFRNQHVQQYTIVTKEQFKNNIACTFKCEYDPNSKKQIIQKFNQKDFVDMNTHKEDQETEIAQPQDDNSDESNLTQWDSHLFELAAKKRIDKLQFQNNNSELVNQISIKYQVLCSTTAFIGVIKQKTKNQNQINSVNVDNFIQFKTLNYNKKKITPSQSSRVQKIGNRQVRSNARGSMAVSGSNYDSACASISLIKSSACNMKKSAPKKGPGIFSGIGSLFFGGGSAAAPPKQQNLAPRRSSPIREQMMMGCQRESTMDYSKSTRQSKREEYGLESCSMAMAQSSVSYGSMQIGACMSQAPSSHQVQEKIIYPSFNGVINFQSIEGFWSLDSKSRLYQFLSDSFKTQIENFLNDVVKCNKNLKDSELVIKLVLTILAFDIIGKQFQDNKEEWRMIAKKVIKWIKSTKETIQNTETASKIIDQVNTFEQKIKSEFKYCEQVYHQTEVDSMQARLDALNGL